MAHFGAAYPCAAVIDVESTSALPTYETGQAIGRLVKADLTVNLASGELYSDDELSEHIAEFASGQLAMETDDLIDTIAAVVYGATVSDDEVAYGADDEAPYMGLAYYKRLIRAGVKVYKAYFYPKVKASLGSDNAQTKGSSLTLGTTQTTFTIFKPKFGAWRYTKEFSSESAAIGYIDTKLGVSTPDALALSSSDPADNDTGTVATIAPELTFSNRIASEAITLTKADGTAVTVTKTWDSTYKILTLTPSSSLTAGTVYLLVVAGVKDIYAQTLATTIISFTIAE